MEIRLNKEILDVTLENEQVLIDVVQELRRHIEEAGLSISAISHNGEILSPADKDSWSHLPISDIGTIDITARPMREILFEHLNTLRQYLSMVQKAFEKRNSALLADLASEYPAVHNSIDTLLSDGLHSTVHDRDRALPLSDLLDEQIRKYGVFSGTPSYDDGNDFSPWINGIITLISERIREVSAPAEELKKAAETLKAALSHISDVSILLQTGKDREAMGSVLTFIELVSKILRLYPPIIEESGTTVEDLSIGDKNFKDYYTDFNSILYELLEAFSVNDSVLIGDLLEYEIVPRLEALLPSLQILVNAEEKT